MPFRHRVSIDDPAARLGDLAEAVRLHASAALTRWSEFVSGKGEIHLRVSIVATAQGRFAGRSLANRELARRGRTRIVEDGVPYKLRTGEALGEVDAEIAVAPDFLREEVWFDPAPARRRARVPKRKIDAMSCFLHEFAHCLGINGHRDLMTGRPKDRATGIAPEAISPFDRHVEIRSGRFYFAGPKTVSLYGGKLPLTSRNGSQNLYHYGDDGRGAARLGEGLMNGMRFCRGRRYDIGALEIALLQDLGITAEY